MEQLLKLYQSKCPKLPIVRKCCFCVPIRKGVTIFGYVNLALNLLAIPLLVFSLLEYITNGKVSDPSFTHMDPQVHLPVTLAFCLIDTGMTVVLLVGAHRKKNLLLKIYLYFGVVFQLGILCLDLVYFDYWDYVENVVYFFVLIFNICLLYMVYSTVHIIEESSNVQYAAYLEHRQQSV